ncbi:chemokine (C-X-C motif) ligand 12a (stromal cell-derived factor 1) [Takifugu rubripes]|uniref:Chemokine (C-X-C motif) ligand 12a (stromal cell-derived factor 1) n=1 Tax=Takifugu rubripes TaxID=31033 RepID=A0A3B5JW76_TAKRU|nr:stromal cell-derived factor 1-like [Takifugu rubripes]
MRLKPLHRPICHSYSGLYAEQDLTATRTMDVKLMTLVAAIMVTLNAPPSQAKPISLVERCYCRSTVSNLPRSYIRELRFIHTPNCPFQVIAKLKTNKEVCVNPEIRWLQQYLKNAINKMKKLKHGN